MKNRYFVNIPVKFDPSNKFHMQAYEIFITTGKHHPEIRFILEFPHLSLPHALHQIVAEYHLKYSMDKETEINNLNEVKTVAMRILTNLKRNKVSKLTLDNVESLLEGVILKKQ